MNFYDFQIRAWRVDEEHAQVMVHSSPAGDIRKPLTVALVPDMLNSFRRLVNDYWKVPPGTTQQIIKAGNVGTLIDQDIGTVQSGGSVAGVVDRRVGREDADT
jgi:hypothetical protein